MNNWSQFLISSLEVTFPHHVHDIWSCASSQLNIPAISDSELPALPTVPYSVPSAKPFKGIFTNYLWFFSLLSSQLLQKSSLQSFFYKEGIFQLFKRKTFKAISALLLTLSHHLFPHPVCPFHTSFPHQSFPSMRLSPRYYWQTRQRLFSIADFICTLPKSQPLHILFTLQGYSSPSSAPHISCTQAWHRNSNFHLLPQNPIVPPAPDHLIHARSYSSD